MLTLVSRGNLWFTKWVGNNWFKGFFTSYWIKGGFRWGALGLKHPPPKFYYEQARKLLEAVVQVHLHFIHIYGQ